MTKPASGWAQLRVVPGRRLAYGLGALSPLLLLGSPWPLITLLADCVLLGLAFIEARRLCARLPELSRSVSERLALGGDNRVSILLDNSSDVRVRGRICDDAPAEFACAPPQLRFDVEPGARLSLDYSASAHRRGRYRFGALHIQLEGALGLGALIAAREAGADVRVYPSTRAPQRYELALRRGALHGVGIRSARRSGGGGELDQLREYVPGDALRDLAWKASAKRLRPITRVHGQEQSQNVLVALDAGRLMAAPLDALSKLDHAIHAALLLAWVALRSGDRVGLIVFEREVLHFLPPSRGRAQYRRILECAYALQAGDAYVDFRALASFVRRHVPRRSLLLVFSDLLDESQALPLAAELPKLRPKHLPLCVTLSDPLTSQLAWAPAAREQEVYMRAAATDVLAERALMKRQLTRAGVQVVEAAAAELAAQTVNRYLEIKRRHAL